MVALLAKLMLDFLQANKYNSVKIVICHKAQGGEPMKKTSWIIGAVFLVALIVFVCFILNLGKASIEPMTVSSVSTILESHGYQPVDSTETALADNPGWDLTGCIKVDNGEIELEFYEFKSRKSAKDIYGSAYRYIKQNKMAVPRRQLQARGSNYVMYRLEAGDNYAISICVETTAVYAFCNKEYADELDSILYEMGYYDHY